jgi:hypothetical protein
LFDGQVGYHLQVVRQNKVVYDSMEIHGGTLEHKISEYLANGQYTFRVRGMNELSLWSEWSDRSMMISFTRTLDITLTGGQIPYGAQLSFEVEAR